MRISTGWSILKDTAQATSDAYRVIQGEIQQPVSLLIIYASVEHDLERLLVTLDELAPGIPVHGSTSCLGVMTAAGFHAEDGIGLGILAISDPGGSYGVGVARLDADPRASGARAIEAAIASAGRLGEPPELVWLNGAPGAEEAVLQGIQDVLGPDVPIAGGSSADNTVEGHWRQFAFGSVYHDAVVVTAMFPSTAVHVAFHSGYSSTELVGRVTRAEGRTLHEIDHQPAARVYNEWTGGSIEPYLEGGNVLSATSLYPLGRQVGAVGDVPYHRLSHPDSVSESGALTLFSNIEEGDEVILFKGTSSSLISRAGRVARTAMDKGHVTPDDIAGALVIYCAGCMLTVQERMVEVAAELRRSLGGSPFLGAFTFGEQGCFTGGESHHGNLMISVVVFEKDADWVGGMVQALGRDGTARPCCWRGSLIVNGASRPRRCSG